MRRVCAESPSGRAGRLRSMIRRYPLTSFFAVAFAGTWAVNGVVLGVLDMPITAPLAAVGPFAGPTLAAFVVLGLTGGADGVRALLRGYLRWRVSWRWYPIAILLMPALTLVAVLVEHPDAFTGVHPPTAGVVLSAATGYLQILALGGPLGEEPGWRGFALPRLMRRYGPLPGTLVLGALHAMWHLPVYLLMPGYNRSAPGPLGTAVSFGLFVVGVLALTVVFTWVFNNTRGSLLLAILLHASVNSAGIAIALFHGSPEPPSDAARTVILVAVAVGIIAFTRGRLGYPHYLRETVDAAPHRGPRT